MSEISSEDRAIILSDQARAKRAQLEQYLPMIELNLRTANTDRELPSFVLDACADVLKSFDRWKQAEQELILASA